MLVPAINPEDYMKPQKPKDRIKTKVSHDYKSAKLVEKHSSKTIGDMEYSVEQCEQLKKTHYLYKKTVVE